MIGISWGSVLFPSFNIRSSGGFRSPFVFAPSSFRPASALRSLAENRSAEADGGRTSVLGSTSLVRLVGCWEMDVSVRLAPATFVCLEGSRIRRALSPCFLPSISFEDVVEVKNFCITREWTVRETEPL